MNNFIKTILKPTASSAIILLFLIGLGGFLLNYFGILKPVLQTLDSDDLSIKIGEVRLSVYLVLKSILALAILFWCAGLVSAFGEKKIKNLKKVKASTKAIMTKIVQILIYFVAFLIALDVIGIDLTALAVFSGAIGIGLGFGLQKITSNFISGIILLFEKSVEVDDIIELSNGTLGTVKRTNARYTLIETFDGKEIMVPNEEFIASQVTNLTYTNTKGRVDVHIGVAYGSDLEKVKQIMLDCAAAHKDTSKEKEPACYLTEFADSSINFFLMFWVEDVTQGRLGIKSDVMMAIWKEFNNNNIEIPFPQRDINIKDLAKIREVLIDKK